MSVYWCGQWGAPAVKWDLLEERTHGWRLKVRPVARLKPRKHPVTVHQREMITYRWYFPLRAHVHVRLWVTQCLKLIEIGSKCWVFIHLAFINSCDIWGSRRASPPCFSNTQTLLSGVSGFNKQIKDNKRDLSLLYGYMIHAEVA